MRSMTARSSWNQKSARGHRTRLQWKYRISRVFVQSCLLLINAGWSFAQAAPDSADRPWRSPAGQQFARDAQRFRDSRLKIDPSKVYTLAELVDFAEGHHPLTRVAWENAAAR